MTIRDHERKDLASIKLNLYELSTGPFHHDMILQNKSMGFRGRLLFDLKMKQKTVFFRSTPLHSRDLARLIKGKGVQFLHENNSY